MEAAMDARTTGSAAAFMDGHGWEAMDPAGNQRIAVLVVRDVSVEHAIVEVGLLLNFGPQPRFKRLVL